MNMSNQLFIKLDLQFWMHTALKEYLCSAYGDQFIDLDIDLIMGKYISIIFFGMTIKGSCLCGGVEFQFEEAVGPFEICHCNRCRKLSGAQGMPALGVSSKGFRFNQGQDLIQTYTAPILYQAPAYHAFFCKNCGSPLPSPATSEDWLEVPAGLLDDDPGIHPDKHIFIEFVPAWDEIKDPLPKFDVSRLYQARYGVELPDEFELRSHYEPE